MSKRTKLLDAALLTVCVPGLMSLVLAAVGIRLVRHALRGAS